MDFFLIVDIKLEIFSTSSGYSGIVNFLITGKIIEKKRILLK